MLLDNTGNRLNKSTSTVCQTLPGHYTGCATGVDLRKYLLHTLHCTQLRIASTSKSTPCHLTWETSFSTKALLRVTFTTKHLPRTRLFNAYHYHERLYHETTSCADKELRGSPFLLFTVLTCLEECF